MTYSTSPAMHFNPRSPHGERRHRLELLRPHDDFNPRSPHGERLSSAAGTGKGNTFQSTLPARGATCARVGKSRNHGRFQSTLPARGATFPLPLARARATHFNPRSPHGERRNIIRERKRVVPFQSTLPARGATTRFRAAIDRNRISIHAPRTGSDRSIEADGKREE